MTVIAANSCEYKVSQLLGEPVMQAEMESDKIPDPLHLIWIIPA